MWNPKITLHWLAIISIHCQTATSASTMPSNHKAEDAVHYSVNGGYHRNIPGTGLEKNQYSNQDCLERYRICDSKQGICKIDLDIFKQFCGDWRNEKNLLACPRAYFKECRSALNTVLLGRPNLKYCTCDGQPSRSIEELSKCNLLRRNLNDHPCLLDQPVFVSEELRITDEIQQVSQNRLEESSRHSTTVPNPLTKYIGSGRTTKDDTIYLDSTHIMRTANTSAINSSDQIQRRQEQPIPLVSPAPYVSNGNGSNTSATSSQNASLSGVLKVHLKSCLLFLDSCTERPSCARALNNFRALCNFRSCTRLMLHCGKAYKELQKHLTPWNCTCYLEKTMETKQRCQDYQTKIMENKCVVEWKTGAITEDSGSPYSYDNHLLVEPANESTPPPQLLSPNKALHTDFDPLLGKNTSLMRPEKLSIANSRRLNCFTLYVNCMSDAACLQSYLILLQRCSLPTCPESINYAPDVTVLRRIDYNLAIRALSCQCPTDDLDCLQQQRVFHLLCEPKGELSVRHCLKLWMVCRLSTGCRETYHRLRTECSENIATCSSDPLICISLYRQLLLYGGSRSCSCGSTNDSIVGTHWIDGACMEFQGLLGQTPCLNNSVPNVNQIPVPTNFTVITTLRACEVAKKLHLPSTSLIKLNINESTGHRCHAFCTCANGCTRKVCISQKNFTELLNHMENAEDVEWRARMSPWLDFNAICLYAPSFDRACSCITDSHLRCSQFADKNTECFKDYQLEIDYNLAVLAVVLSTRWENKTGDRLRQLFQLVYMLAYQLTEVVQKTRGSRVCRLMSVEHHWRGSRNLTGRRTGVKMKENSSDSRDGEFRSSVILTIQNSKHSDCNLFLRLMEAMINHQLPQIVYHPILSALESARLVCPMENDVRQEKLCREGGAVRLPSTTSSHAWRKQRTSLSNTDRMSLSKMSTTVNQIQLVHIICLFFTMICFYAQNVVNILNAV